MFKFSMFCLWNISLHLIIKLSQNVTNLCICQIDEVNAVINASSKICIIIVACLRHSVTHSETWMKRWINTQVYAGITRRACHSYTTELPMSTRKGQFVAVVVTFLFVFISCASLAKSDQHFARKGSKSCLRGCLRRHEHFPGNVSSHFLHQSPSLREGRWSWGSKHLFILFHAKQYFFKSLLQ